MVAEGSLTLDAADVGGILQKLYTARIQFPLTSKEAMVQALGGGAIPVAGEGRGTGITADQVGTLAFSKLDSFEHPDAVVDTILDTSYVATIAKSMAMDIAKAAPYPIPGKAELAVSLKGLAVLGIDLEELGEAAAFPVGDPDTLMATLAVVDPSIYGASVPLISGIGARAPMDEEARELIPGFTYLVMEEKPQNCYETFSELVQTGFEGLGISRTNPKNLHAAYDFGRAEVLWLTDRDTESESSISSSLETLMDRIESFMSDNPMGAILLDGLEFLVSIHGFDPVQRFTRQLKDIVSEGEFILIFPISQYVLEQQQIKSLERELETVPEGERLVVGEGLREILQDFTGGTAVPRETAPPSAPEPAPQPEPAAEPEPTPEPEPEPGLKKKLTLKSPPGPASEPPVEPETAVPDGPPSGEGAVEAAEAAGAEAAAETEVIIPEGKEACSSCEGKGRCYWCGGSKKCHTCDGGGNIAADKQCRSCKGTGTCASCSGTGECYWCEGKGYAED